MIEDALAIVLAGGVGSRLQPLTKDRAKPAVPFGGKYRVIDFTLTNCLHSGIRQVLVLTQYKSHSLQKHLRDGWSIYNPELGEFITPVPPQMRTGEDWYRGTADAIYQNLYLLERNDAEQVLILSGDHIYRMDYAELLRQHRLHANPATLACMEVPIAQARHFGIVETGQNQHVSNIVEQPHDPKSLATDPGLALASMGIYVFDREFLIESLKADHLVPDSTHDFGRDILPALVERPGIFVYQFGGKDGRVTQDRYWRDVSDIDSYYAANMDLLEPVPPLDLYQPEWVIRTYQAQLPPARTVPGPSGNEGVFVNAILAGGVIISGGGVDHSVLFPSVKVGDEAIVEDSILFEGVEIGARCRVRKAIIEKGVHVPADTQIGMDPESDRRLYHVSEQGVVVVPKGFEFPIGGT